MYLTIFIFILVALALIIFFQLPKFGRLPSGDRLIKITASPNFRNGTFQNQSITPDLTEGATYFSVLKKFIFEKKERNKPLDIIPSIKTNLLNMDAAKDVLIWLVTLHILYR